MVSDLLHQAAHARENGDFEVAAGLYETLLAKDRTSIEALAGLGVSLSRLGRFGPALPYLKQAEARGSLDPAVSVALGDAYFSLGPIASAASAYARAAALLPESGRARVKLAYSLIRLGRADEAEGALREAIELEPSLAAAHDMMAFLLPQMGRFEEAKGFARTAASLDPAHPAYGVRVVYGARVEEDDAGVVDRLRSIAGATELGAKDRVQVQFGLGKAMEDLGRFEAAAKHYVAANALADAEQSRHGIRFDKRGHQEEVDYLLETVPPFDPALGLADETPVFVVGMMRSGSTLAEQILSSHPEVGGAGEVPFWIENAPRLHHAVVAQKATGALRRTAAEYLDVLNALTPGKRRICDKLLQNYMSLGILHAALPNARIVHCRRDPRDTCLSVFTTPFTLPPPFAYRADTIASAYRQYLRLMARWRDVLPADRFLEIDYEELVTDRERVSRRMIDFLGLEWDDACLRPQDNPRLVGNPSQWQVRQPVYASSIGRWRRFEPWMSAQIEQWSLA